MVDGSGKEDGDMDNSSGHGPDDEDSEDGSAGKYPLAPHWPKSAG